MLVQITCYHNRVWLYIISTNTKMFKNPKWITFDILGLCNQLLATQLTQRAIQLLNDLQRFSAEYDLDTIIGDHFQLKVYDPRSIERRSFSVPRSCTLSMMIVYFRTWSLDGLCQMVQIGPKVVRRWSEGGRDYGHFGDDAKMWVVLLVSWLCNQLLAIWR